MQNMYRRDVVRPPGPDLETKKNVGVRPHHPLASSHRMSAGPCSTRLRAPQGFLGCGVFPATNLHAPLEGGRGSDAIVCIGFV